MAIAKMNKVMLIAPTDKQNDLLDAIQELQSLEVTSLEQAKELFTKNSIALQEADAEGIERSSTEIRRDSCGYYFCRKKIKSNRH